MADFDAGQINQIAAAISGITQTDTAEQMKVCGARHTESGRTVTGEIFLDNDCNIGNGYLGFKVEATYPGTDSPAAGMPTSGGRIHLISVTPNTPNATYAARLHASNAAQALAESPLFRSLVPAAAPAPAPVAAAVITIRGVEVNTLADPVDGSTNQVTVSVTGVQVQNLPAGATTAVTYQVMKGGSAVADYDGPITIDGSGNGSVTFNPKGGTPLIPGTDYTVDVSVTVSTSTSSAREHKVSAEFAIAGARAAAATGPLPLGINPARGRGPILVEVTPPRGGAFRTGDQFVLVHKGTASDYMAQLGASPGATYLICIGRGAVGRNPAQNCPPSPSGVVSQGTLGEAIATDPVAIQVKRGGAVVYEGIFNAGAVRREGPPARRRAGGLPDARRPH